MTNQEQFSRRLFKEVINEGLYTDIPLSGDLSQGNAYEFGIENRKIFCPICNSIMPYILIQTEPSFGNMIEWSKVSYYVISGECLGCHVQKFRLTLLKIKDDPLTVIKIGQYPSIADLSNNDLKKYRKVTKNESIVELKKALGLYSHGIGIGSYVYLRRIIERIIFDTIETEIQAGKLSPTDISGKKTTEKISLLKDALPSFLVDNKLIYGILSKGIHELDEEFCLRNFEFLHHSIIMILDQEKELFDKKQKENELAKLLSTCISSLKG